MLLGTQRTDFILLFSKCISVQSHDHSKTLICSIDYPVDAKYGHHAITQRMFQFISKTIIDLEEPEERSWSESTAPANRTLHKDRPLESVFHTLVQCSAAVFYGHSNILNLLNGLGLSTFLGWPFCVILFLKQINLLFC